MVSFEGRQAPRASQSIASLSQIVDIIVFALPLTNISGKSTIHLKDLPLPLKFDNIARELIQAGHNEPTRLILRQHPLITITDGPSGGSADEGWQVNIDQPLLHFYHKVFLGKDARDPPDYVSEAKMVEGGNTALVAGLHIEFYR
ncbi:hypothetical protein OG21DRAFT_1490671 [Imleria badia]|nr:hypothetical protein OG21DRAFT_1490671 [Imleria badia]